MILTRQEVEIYKKCWENLQDCDDCPLNTNDGRCVITGSRLAETILHYMDEVEKWKGIADGLYQGVFEQAFGMDEFLQEAIQAYEQAEEAKADES